MISLKEFYSKKYLIGIFFLISFFYSAQNQIPQIEQIDLVLFVEIKKMRSESKFNEVISLSEKAIENSQKIQYKRGEAWGNVRLGNAYCSLGKYKESLASLNKAKKISELLNDDALNAIISIETGRNYFESKISKQQAIQQFLKAESYALKIKDKYDRETYLLYAYQSLMATYSDTDKKDLAISYAWKSLQIEEDAYTLSYVTHHHLKTSKNNDSIIYYLEKSTDFLKNYPELSFEKSILANQWGKYYEKRNSFRKQFHITKKPKN